MVEVEASYIKLFDSTNPEKGYNLSVRAGGNYIRTPEQLLQMSNSRLGHEVKQETRNKISKANKGRIQPPEEIEKRKIALQGKFEHMRKRIKILETGDVFESLTECAIKFFNKETAATNISAVIRGKRKAYRGFTFEYI